LRARVGARCVLLRNAFLNERHGRAGRLEGRPGRSPRIRPRRGRGGLRNGARLDEGRGGDAGRGRRGTWGCGQRGPLGRSRTFKKEYDIDPASGPTRSG
jgi:hypothetical protein